MVPHMCVATSPRLDNALEEGEETCVPKARDAQGAAIGHGEAVGTIGSSQPASQDVARALRGHVTVAVSDPLSGSLARAPSGSRMSTARSSSTAASRGSSGRHRPRRRTAPVRTCGPLPAGHPGSGSVRNRPPAGAQGRSGGVLRYCALSLHFVRRRSRAPVGRYRPAIGASSHRRARAPANADSAPRSVACGVVPRGAMVRPT